MDRKALSLCAAAATASLGALLSAGCGADSAGTPSSARKEPRRSVTPPAVVVSPSKDFLTPDQRIASTRDRGQPQVAVAQADTLDIQSTTTNEASTTQPLDPWAANPAVATETSPVETVMPAAEESSAPYDAAEVSSANTEVSIADAEALEPTPAESTDSEVRFGTSETSATEDEAAEKTITLDVGPRGKKPSKAPIARTPRPVGSKSELTPVLVTPRQAPQAELAQQESEPVRDEIEPPIAKPAPQQPTLAKPVAPVQVAEQAPAVDEEPIAEVVPTPAVVKHEPQPLKVVDEPATAKKLVAAPQVAMAPIAPKSEPVAASKPATKSEPVDKSDPVATADPAIEQKPAPIAKSEPVVQAEPVVTIKLVPTPAETPAPKVEVAATPPSSPAPEAAAAPVAVAKTTPAVPTPIAVAPAAESTAPEASAPVVRQVPKATAPIVAATPAPAPMAPAAVEAAPAPVATPAPAPIVATAPSLPQAALPQVATVRSPAMVATLARADERVRHAIQLAEKGAMYASRKEFTAAITAIAQAHDVEHGTRHYSQATAAGFQAIKEASEFNGAGEVDVRSLVAGHRTPVLKQFDVSDLPPTLAAQYYYNFAKEQLATGVGRETVGSIALYGLAKIVIAGAGANAQQLEYTGPAMALYQAALICEPQNFRAAHELGVLLAGSGQLELAREMLMGSVASSPQPVMLKNLAVVHSRLGEQQLAADAQQKAEILTQTSPNTNTPAVQWVDPATFATMGAGADPTHPPTAATNPQGSKPRGSEPTKTPANVARKRTTDWNPLNLRR